MSALTCAVTVARTLCQNAFVLVVGCMGCLGRNSLIPFTCRLTYRPVVENSTVLLPRAELTLMVIFA